MTFGKKMIRSILLIFGTLCLLGCQGKTEVVIEGETIRHNGNEIDFDQLMELADSAKDGEITLVIRNGSEIEEQDLKEFKNGIDFIGAIFDGDEEPLSWREYLPEDAVGIEEFSWADGFLPDYSYMLKAEVSVRCPRKTEAICMRVRLRCS